MKQVASGIGNKWHSISLTNRCIFGISPVLNQSIEISVRDILINGKTDLGNSLFNYDLAPLIAHPNRDWNSLHHFLILHFPLSAAPAFAPQSGESAKTFWMQGFLGFNWPRSRAKEIATLSWTLSPPQRDKNAARWRWRGKRVKVKSVNHEKQASWFEKKGPVLYWQKGTLLFVSECDPLCSMTR